MSRVVGVGSIRDLKSIGFEVDQGRWDLPGVGRSSESRSNGRNSLEVGRRAVLQGNGDWTLSTSPAQIEWLAGLNSCKGEDGKVDSLCCGRKGREDGKGGELHFEEDIKSE